MLIEEMSLLLLVLFGMLSYLLADAQNSFPIFQNTLYFITIPEDTAIGLSVGSLTATGSISYSITDSISIVSIDANMGELTLDASIDREVTFLYQHQVAATNSVGSTFVNLFVIISDVNDNSPVFSNAPYTESISESASVGNNVIDIYAEDIDIGSNAAITFSIMSGNINDAFQINSVNGTISLKNSLDYETLNYYLLSVLATDGGTVPLSNQVSVFISVLDSDDLPPQFSQASYDGEVLEGAAGVNAMILQVTATDGDTGVNDTIIYGLNAGVTSNQFSLDIQSGALSVGVAPLNREATPVHYLVITAIGTNNAISSAAVNITVTVLDINDSPPVFINSPYYVSISEGVAVGTTISTGIQTTDADSGSNALHQFIIDGYSSVFSITPENGNLVVIDALDRETQDSYSLTIIANETYPDVSSSSQAALFITVTDINDNSPMFLYNNYSSFVEEGPLSMTDATVPFIIITAQDEDIGMAGNVTYFLSGENSYKFRVSGTGELFKAIELDREAADTYVILLVATDQDSNMAGRRSTVVELTISVTDVNDNPPTCVSANTTISESSMQDTQVLQVSADDLDIGINAEIEFIFLPSSNPVNAFTIDSQSGIITVTDTLDREDISLYQLVVVVSDRGIGSLNGNCTINIEVLDFNDRDPMFTESQYSVSIAENTTDGTIILTVSATDDDANFGNQLLHYLLETTSSTIPFELNSATGNISVSGSLDRDTPPDTYIFNVMAVDSGDPPRTGSTMVRIILLDSNDNPPEITNANLFADVTEDSSIGTIVIDLDANDADLGLNQEIAFSIVNGNINNIFSIDNGSGVIVVDTPPKWTASLYLYYLIIQVTDGGFPALSSTASVTITIIDINNNNPMFIGAPYSFQVTEGSNIGSIIGSVSAIDADDPLLVNGQVAYSIQFGNVGSAFLMESTSGQISIANIIDRETIATYILTVIARDLTATPLSNTTDIIVTVIDINDNPPSFEFNDYTVFLTEESPPDIVVTSLSAQDIDDGTNGLITYSISSGNEASLYRIDSNNGTVYTTNIPTNREQFLQHDLTIEAQDRGDSPRIGRTELHIVLSDINDNYPQFSELVYAFSVSEASAVATTIGSVTATDSDAGVNGTIRYITVPGTPFSIGVLSGDIYIGSNEINRENIDSYLIFVEAFDMNVEAPKSTIVNVSVTILDFNDNHPIFLNVNNTISVFENTTVGSTIFISEVEDTDIGLNGEYYFTLIGGDGKFQINSDSGHITLSSDLDRNFAQSYSLTLTVTDKGIPTLSSEFSLQVLVVDTNNHPPTFPSTNPIMINESVLINSSITTLSAYDPDDGSNSMLTYAFADPSSVTHFTLTSDGMLVLREKLDYEVVRGYAHVVIATDAGNPSMSGSTLINITILDDNDNEPVFSQSQYRAGVLSSSVHGTTITTITASDEDSEEFASIIYEIVNTNNVNRFSIIATSGEIQTSLVFSGQEGMSYDAVILAYDNNKMSRTNSASTLLTVTIITTEYLLVMRVSDTQENVAMYSASVVNILQESSSDEIFIVLYDITAHVMADSTIDNDKSDIYFFGIDAVTGSLIDQSVLLKNLDVAYILNSQKFANLTIESIIPFTTADNLFFFEPFYWVIICVLALMLVCCLCCCVGLFFKSRNLRRKQERGTEKVRISKSVLHSLADLSTISSRFFSSSAAIENPLYQPAYDQWSSQQTSTIPTMYESQEIVMDMFTDNESGSRTMDDSQSRSYFLPDASDRNSALLRTYQEITQDYDSNEIEIDFMDIYANRDSMSSDVADMLEIENEVGSLSESDENTLSTI